MQYTRWVVIFQQGNNLSHLNKCVCVLSVRFYVVFCSRFFCSVWMLSNLHIWLFSWFLPLVHRALVTSKLCLLYTSYIAIHQLPCTPNKLWFEFFTFFFFVSSNCLLIDGGRPCVHVWVCGCVSVCLVSDHHIKCCFVAFAYCARGGNDDVRCAPHSNMY